MTPKVNPPATGRMAPPPTATATVWSLLDETGPIPNAVTLQGIEGGSGGDPATTFLHTVTVERFSAALVLVELLAADASSGGPRDSVLVTVLHALAAEQAAYYIAYQGTSKFEWEDVHERPRALMREALRLLSSCIVRTQRRGLAVIREAASTASHLYKVNALTSSPKKALPRLWLPIAAGLLSEAFDFAPAMQLDVLRTVMMTCGETTRIDPLIPSLSRLASRADSSDDVAFACVHLLSMLSVFAVGEQVQFCDSFHGIHGFLLRWRSRSGVPANPEAFLEKTAARAMLSICRLGIGPSTKYSKNPFDASSLCDTASKLILMGVSTEASAACAMLITTWWHVKTSVVADVVIASERLVRAERALEVVLPLLTAADGLKVVKWMDAYALNETLFNASISAHKRGAPYPVVHEAVCKAITKNSQGLVDGLARGLENPFTQLLHTLVVSRGNTSINNAVQHHQIPQNGCAIVRACTDALGTHRIDAGHVSRRLIEACGTFCMILELLVSVHGAHSSTPE